MSFTPNERQALYLWALIANGGEGYCKDLTYRLNKAAERTALVKVGLIDEEKRERRAIYNTLSERGWTWVRENMKVGLPKRAQTGALLEALVVRLGAYMRASGTSLAELIVPEQVASGSSEELRTSIQQAYQQLSNGKWNVRVRLADLRAALPSIDRSALDNELLKMQREDLLALYSNDDPLDVTEADRGAAIDIAGEQRTLIYMGA